MPLCASGRFCLHELSGVGGCKVVGSMAQFLVGNGLRKFMLTFMDLTAINDLPTLLERVNNHSSIYLHGTNGIQDLDE